MPKKEILVVGGAGYIGSHMVLTLQRSGYLPVILDNLSTGHHHSVSQAEFILGDMNDSVVLEKLLSHYDFCAVLHFASYIQTGESVQNPMKYYQNNLAATLNLLTHLIKRKIRHFIFSSSAAVYGEPQYLPIDEQHPLSPLNPYGQSKRMIEQILSDFSRVYDFNYASLRYFNAAGSEPKSGLAEHHQPETHLIPLVLQAARSEAKAFTLYGNDYPTLDGTCIRDFIHVSDLCRAHLLALEFLLENRGINKIYNLGTGKGYSVKEVIETAEKITGVKIPVVLAPRREGDPAVLVSDPQLAKKELGWTPEYSGLDTIIRHASISLALPQSEMCLKFSPS